DHPHIIDNQTCLDGILVGGKPGRDGREYRVSWYRNPIRLGGMHFVLDIRGTIKPPITPARTPPDNRNYSPFSNGPRWDYVQKLVNRAGGRLWEKIAAQLGSRIDHETFWCLAIIYGGPNIDISH